MDSLKTTFLEIYKSFSSSQIRKLQFSFRVLLKDAPRENGSSSSSCFSEGSLQLQRVESFLLDSCHISATALESARKSMSSPAATGMIDLHEFIETVYYLQQQDNDEKSIVPRILEQSRMLQHERTHVPFSKPVPSQQQIQEARREALLSQAKASAILNQNLEGLETFFPAIFESYSVYWKTPDITADDQLEQCIEPLITEGDVIRVLSDTFWNADRAGERLSTLISLIKENRKAEQEARKAYREVFEPDILEKYIRQFRSLDDDYSGNISTAEISSAFYNAGVKLDDETLKEIILEADEDQSGEIDITEWLGMMKKAVKDKTSSKAARYMAEMARKNAEFKEKQRLEAQRRRRENSSRRASILKSFPPHRLASFRSTFESFDVDGSGTIDFEELNAMCRAMDMNVDRQHLRKLFNEVDTDGSGEVDFVEFVEILDSGRKESGVLSNIFYEIASRHDRMASDRRAELMRQREIEIQNLQREKERQREKASMRAEAMKKLSAKEKMAAQKSFQLIDVDGSGALDEQELYEAFKAMGLKMQKKEALKIFKQVDIDNDGTVDIDEFMICVSNVKNNAKYASILRKLGNTSNASKAKEALLRSQDSARRAKLKRKEEASAKAAFRAETLKKYSTAQLKELKSQFNLIDVDSSGELDEAEIFDMFRAMGVKIGKKEGVPKKEIRKVIAEIDEDGSETLDFHEFLLLFNKILTSKAGFLHSTRRRVEEASKRDAKGHSLALDLAAFERLANERKTKRAQRREELNKKSEVHAELLKVFSKREIDQLRTLFNMLDRDRSGQLERDELHFGLLGEGELLKSGSKNAAGAGDTEDSSGESKIETEKEKDSTPVKVQKSTLQLEREELDAALEELDQDGDGSIDWFEFLHLMKSIQEGKGSTGGRLIHSLAEKKLNEASKRRMQKDQERVMLRRKIMEKSKERDTRAQKNKEALELKNTYIREAKAVSRKQKAEAARKRREEKYKEIQLRKGAHVE